MYPGSASVVAGGIVSGAAAAGGTLPKTGTAVTGYLIAAIVAIVLGLLLIVVGKVRDHRIGARNAA